MLKQRDYRTQLSFIPTQVTHYYMAKHSSDTTYTLIESIEGKVGGRFNDKHPYLNLQQVAYVNNTSEVELVAGFDTVAFQGTFFKIYTIPKTNGIETPWKDKKEIAKFQYSFSNRSYLEFKEDKRYLNMLAVVEELNKGFQQLEIAFDRDSVKETLTNLINTTTYDAGERSIIFKTLYPSSAYMTGIHCITPSNLRKHYEYGKNRWEYGEAILKLSDKVFEKFEKEIQKSIKHRELINDYNKEMKEYS
jgi:hypothetical protein